MNDFNLMLAKYNIYVLNQENGKFLLFAPVPKNIYAPLAEWRDGAKKGIYPPLVQGTFLIVRESEPVPNIQVYVLCRQINEDTSSTDEIVWRRMSL